MNPLISPAYAQAANGGGISGFLSGSPLGQFLPLILIFVLFYFLMIKPQQDQQKKLKARLAAVKKGDRVQTAGGIVGVVTKAREGAAEIDVEIAPNVRVVVMRDTLTNVLNPATSVAANDTK
ncbi:MAG TPA: preprotein translocase subunit YajC [Acetobacteraceae bacterium]|nr:preprotein translocase subunit YajC [Acetobacteraceae bacterium]